MAKEQGLALNPTKISGQCGRLLCCLGYEFETYSALKKGMPKCGKKIAWQDREYNVTSIDILRQQINLRDQEGSCCCITLRELQSGQAEQPAVREDAAGEPHTSRMSRRRQEPRKQPDRSRKSPDPTDEQAQQADPDKDQPGQQAADEGKSQKKPRRRGRRRPRGKRKPGPGKQGE
jgi:hypothetical protein